MYQRMVSYIYEYVNGEKGGNIGFAKIATQNQQFKIKVHMKNFAMNGKELEVYGFVRGEKVLHSACFGKVKLVNGIGEGVFTGNTGEVWERYRFMDMSGIVFCMREQETGGYTGRRTIRTDRFCGTQWDEKVIDIRELDLVQSEVGMIKHNQKWRNAESLMTKETTCSVEETENETDREKNFDRNEERVLVKAAELDEMEQVVVKEKVLENGRLETDSKMEVGIPEEQGDMVAFLEEQQEKSRQKSADRMENHQEFLSEQESSEDIWNMFQKRRVEMEQELQRLKNKKEEKTVWQPGEEIFEKYPPMCPFFDSDVLQSVRIEPKDLGVFPMEFWYLANNSFLLHGYYCYRHLLFLKMQIENETVYAIAIPGNSQYREKFMANMFGFEHFKPVQKKENAGFGYWWKRLY